MSVEVDFRLANEEKWHAINRRFENADHALMVLPDIVKGMAPAGRDVVIRLRHVGEPQPTPGRQMNGAH